MRFTMILNESEAKALQRVSVNEDRHPRDQARRLLRESLERIGALSDPKIQPDPRGPGAAA